MSSTSKWQEKKEQLNKRGKCSRLRDSGDIRLNAIYRHCLDPVLNSPAIEKKRDN